MGQAKGKAKEEGQVGPAVAYRCTRGHAWQSREGRERNVIEVEVGMAGRLEHLCPHCLYEILKKLTANLGRVEEAHD